MARIEKEQLLESLKLRDVHSSPPPPPYLTWFAVNSLSFFLPVQVARIETERLLVLMVEKELVLRAKQGAFKGTKTFSG